MINNLIITQKKANTEQITAVNAFFYFLESESRMERVEHTESTIEVFENDIDLYLQEFADRDGIEDFCQVPQSIWNSALRYVYDHVFKPNKQILKSANTYDSTLLTTNYNMYNYDLVLEVLDYYIYNMCQRYNKEVSIIGFTTLTGISESEVYEWGNNTNKLSSTCSEIYKKLNRMREESLSNKLADGKQNPVGVIAMLNRHYGWASPYTSDSNRQKQSLTAAELPKLGASSSNCTTENKPVLTIESQEIQ